MTSRRSTRIAEYLATGGVLGGLRLRTRFVILVIFSVFACAAVNLVLLDTVARRVLSAEVESRAAALARRLADEVARSILRDDVQSLRASLAAMTRVDRGVDYVMVVSRSGAVLASSFTGGIPRGLPAANAPSGNAVGSVIVTDRSVQYRDVAVPILSGELGHVRLGARLDHIESGLLVIRLAVAAMVVLFLTLGILGSYATAHVISAPIERLVSFLHTFDPARPEGDLRLPREVRGELGELTRSVDAMVGRLRLLHAAREAFQSRIVRAERLATVGALAAGIAHEVNNPLAGMRNCLQAIAREPEDLEQTRTYVEMMIEASRSIERTVRALMDGASRSQREMAAVDLAALVERVDLLLRVRFRDAGVTMETDLARGLPAFRSDVGLLQQILVNLLINAGDASPPGSVVTLRIRMESRNMIFEVLDRGAGIAEALRTRVFDPFVTTKERAGGTGLGLAMVRSLVTELDGDVAFEDREGGGTVFRVSLRVSPGLEVDTGHNEREANPRDPDDSDRDPGSSA